MNTLTVPPIPSTTWVHAEHNLYTFACEVVARYPKDIPDNYWDLYESLTEALPRLLRATDGPCEVFACYSRVKGYDDSHLGLLVVPDGVNIETATVSALLTQSMPRSLTDLQTLLQVCKFRIDNMVYAAQKASGRFSLLCQPVVAFDGTSIRAYEEARPTKRNVHVTIDEDMVKHCIRAALPSSLTTAMGEMFGLAA